MEFRPDDMNWDRIQGNWQHFKASARARWELISGHEFDLIGGRREVLASHIHEVYGITLAKAQAQVESWRGEQHEPGPDSSLPVGESPVALP